MSTFMAKEQTVEHKWFVVDAQGKTLGRLATEIASILRGKNKPIFTPHVDTGDFVIVVNAEKIVLTGNKLAQKNYYTHSGYPGGLKTTPYKELMKTHPERAVEHAVKGMIPHTKLGRKIATKLFVYRGPEHPHQAQKPELLEIKG